MLEAEEVEGKGKWTEELKRRKIEGQRALFIDAAAEITALIGFEEERLEGIFISLREDAPNVES